MPDGHRFLLIRLDGIGDALVCVPALEALRTTFPGATFGAVCSPRNAALFSRERVARVHVLGRDDDASERRRLAAELREQGYTDALVATEEPIGYTLGSMSRAHKRAGFWHRLEKPFKSVWQFAHLTDAVYRPAAWVEQPEHEVNAIHRLAQRLGAAAAPSIDPAELRRWLDVETGASTPTAGALALQVARKWFERGWDARALARMTVAALDASPFQRCVLLAGPDDAGSVRAVMEAIPAQRRDAGTITAAETATLRRWLGAIGSAGALLTPDTGAAHAAGMLGVPVVDVFGPVRFPQLSRQWRPWAATARCLVQPENATATAAQEFGVIVGSALADLVAPRGVVS
ncbi:MAG TPA: glycosyltransferase family 9 protein [Candidatus Eremiobacteraceae bacterium]|nr:glycosyltransferase family 9 protein [Candidatus Eremiobacteraceae bacterium]